MIYLFDETWGRRLVPALKVCGRKDVVYLCDLFPSGTKDHEWLPLASERLGTTEWVLITADKRMRTRPNQRIYFHRLRLGMFIVSGNERPRWEMLETLVRNFRIIEHLAATMVRPFAVGVYRAGRPRRVEIREGGEEIVLKDAGGGQGGRP